MFFASNVSSKAQLQEIEPCVYWGQLWPGETEWIGRELGSGFWINIKCGNCTYYVEYYYKVNTFQYGYPIYEYSITSIFKERDNSIPPCTGCTDKEIKQRAFLYIVEWLQIYDPESIIDDNNAIQNIYGVSNYKCENKILFPSEIVMVEIDLSDMVALPTSPVLPIELFPSVEVEWVIYPCSQDEACCLMYYDVNWINYGQNNYRLETIEYDLAQSFYNESLEPCANYPTQCFGKCNELSWNWSIEEGFDYTPKLIFQKKEFSSKDLTISPNPNNSKFTLDFSNEFKGDFNLKVISLIGEVLFETNLIKENSYFQKEIDLTNLSNGQYNLVLTFESNSISKKFIVIK